MNRPLCVMGGAGEEGGEERRVDALKGCSLTTLPHCDPLLSISHPPQGQEEREGNVKDELDDFEPELVVAEKEEEGNMEEDGEAIGRHRAPFEVRACVGLCVYML